MFKILLYGIPVGLLLSIMASTVLLLLIETSIIRGVKSALMLDFGILVADFVYIFLAFKGSEKFKELIDDYPSIYLLGGIAILVYGIYSFFEKKSVLKRDLKVGNNYIGLFFKGFFLNFLNVSMIVFWTTVVITTGEKFDYNQHRMIMALITIMSTYILIDIIKIYIAKKIGNRMKVNNILLMKKITASILMCLGLYFIIDTSIKNWF